jgi:hypothetical protein
MMTIEFRNAAFISNGCIDMEINDPVYGWIPFTATSNDVEAHGRDLFAAAQESATPYVASAPTTDELTAYARELSWQVRAGGATINGVAVKTDGDSIALIGSMYNMARDFPESTFDFDSADGPVSLTSAQAQALAKAVGDWVQLGFKRRSDVFKAIMAGQITTTAEIDEAFVDITDGWAAPA